MIVYITDNMLVDCINLMDKSARDNDYQPYDRNERCWIEHLTAHVREQKLGNPKFLAIADVEPHAGYIRGFILASAFQNYYTQEWVMDVKDCIVDHDYHNGRVVIRLFNAMFDHMKQHGGTLWRADSIRDPKNAELYCKFLEKKFNAVPFMGVHGKLE